MYSCMKTCTMTYELDNEHVGVTAANKGYTKAGRNCMEKLYPKREAIVIHRLDLGMEIARREKCKKMENSRLHEKPHGEKGARGKG